MRNMRKTVTLSGIISGICFAIITLINIRAFGFIFDLLEAVFEVDFIWDGVVFLLTVLSIPAVAILAIGCFTSLKPLKIIGAVLGFLGALAAIIEAFAFYSVDFADVWEIYIVLFLSAIFWVVLLIVFIAPKMKIVAFVSAGIKFITFVIALISYSPSFTGILEYLLFIAGAIFFALEVNVQATSKFAQPPQSSTNIPGTADRILKLKNLLDNGIITAEEFEAKKKQILSL